MNHDRLFKELLSTFFVEFIDLFLPDLSGYIDPDVVLLPLDKEIFSDVKPGSNTVDVLIRAKVRGADTYFLIHVEAQGRSQAGFPRRLFGYFAGLLKKYQMDIYPIAIFSYDKPYRPEPTGFTVAFPGLTVLKFDYTVIQLNRIPWRTFINTPNPVASALMAKMKMANQDRPKVKAECLRLLATLKLDPARARIIGRFIDSYLVMTATESEALKREIADMEPEEREATMELTTSWELKGRHDGKSELIARLLRRQLGQRSTEQVDRLQNLSIVQLDELLDALFDFNNDADLDEWLARHHAN